MITEFWESMQLSTITGQASMQNMMVSRIPNLKVEEGQQALICRVSGIYINKKPIFSEVMHLPFMAAVRSYNDTSGFGENLKENLLAEPTLGPGRVGSGMMGETIPKETNFLSLDADKKDDWGVPLLKNQYLL